MNQNITTGIVLTRTNYQEADRIMTLLTPDNGKLRALARGVRKSKSKLAAGVELFSVSEISFVRGRGELATLTSARLNKHYGRIVQDINRTMSGYEFIKLLNKVTEDEPGPEYFELLQQLFEALDDPLISLELIRLWFYAQLLRLAGHTPNLHTDSSDGRLVANSNYVFVHDDMAFAARSDGPFIADHIKFLRLSFSGNAPHLLQKVQGTAGLIEPCLQLVRTMLPNHIRT
ncbi:MAG TPA: DNA repair protein RecO [Candidatus Limnocylindrales bacterium]|nr:DNA repair protein RecO [Candidatus Limnocylindrales bacterium]